MTRAHIAKSHLRGNIQHCPKLVEEALVGGTEISGTKVNHPDGGVLLLAGHQDVLWLEISMHDAFAVHEGQKIHKAPHHVSSLLLIEVLKVQTLLADVPGMHLAYAQGLVMRHCCRVPSAETNEQQHPEESGE